MRLSDLTKNLSNMSEDELREHVRQMRHNKNVAKPAREKRIQEVEKKESKHRTSKIDKVVAGMSTIEKAQLLLLLEGGE